MASYDELFSLFFCYLLNIPLFNYGNPSGSCGHWRRKVTPRLVTGHLSPSPQNRGIGLAICAALVQQFTGPLILYAASRAGAPIDLTGVAIPPTVQLHSAKLSLTDKASISALSARVQDENKGCDILINNAGLYYFKENITAAQRRETLNVNYRGTVNVFKSTKRRFLLNMN